MGRRPPESTAIYQHRAIPALKIKVATVDIAYNGVYIPLTIAGKVSFTILDGSAAYGTMKVAAFKRFYFKISQEK